MPFDAQAVYRDGATDGNLTASGNSSSIRMTYMKKPFRVVVVVPSVAGTGATLDIAVQHSDDNITFTNLRSFPQITAKGVYELPVATEKPYTRLAFTVGGTGANFGAVSAYMVPA